MSVHAFNFLKDNRLFVFKIHTHKSSSPKCLDIGLSKFDRNGFESCLGGDCFFGIVQIILTQMSKHLLIGRSTSVHRLVYIHN